MTHGKVRGCHMAPQECDTWKEKKEWLTLSHMGGMIPWFILSNVGYDVIKRKRRKMESHTFGLKKWGGNFLLLTHTVNAPKRKRKCKEKKEEK